MRNGRKKGRSIGEKLSVVAPMTVPDWEAAHMFLEVARSGSFRAAAQKLRQSVNALRRKVEAFERDLGTPMLIRHIHGVQLTEDGTKVYNAALQMEQVSFDLLLARKTSDKQVEGEIRLASTDGLGTYWLLPQLIEFQRENPKLSINLRCGQKSADLLRLEADLSVQLERPKSSDLKIVKLGRLHIMYCAAKSYLDKHGRPNSIADLVNHHLVIQSDDERQWQRHYQEHFSGLSTTGPVAIRNNLSIAHGWSVTMGAGIGALPTYIHALGANLATLDFGLHWYDIWLGYHPDARRIARARKTIDWIVQSFDPHRYPWFRDEFIHPDQFSKVYKGKPLPIMFMPPQK